MPNIDSALQWMYDRLGKVSYSMDRRNGPSSYDCSSAVYYSLKQGGYVPADKRIGNTDSLFGDLERAGWVRVPEASNGYIDTKRGDIFIWGKRGASSGAFGHTGWFVNANDIIHCAFGYNGIHVDNHDWLAGINGYPEVTVYRYSGVSAPVNNNPIDQDVAEGSYIKLDKVFRADDVQLIDGIWQVRTNELCKVDFTWAENGIPAEPLIEVDNEGFATPDQNLDIGSLYKLPGKYKVLDVGAVSGMWLALIEWNGLKFWVDLEPATEVDINDAGTATPGQRPHQPPAPPVPDVPPVVQNPDPVPETPPTDTPQPEPPKEEPKPPVEPKPPINNPKEDKDMAFSKKQNEELKINREDIMKTLNDIAASQAGQQIIGSIPQKTKVIVYLIGDSLLGLGAITPQVIQLMNTTDPFTISTTLSSLLATSGLFLLTMFGIYKSGKS